MTVKLHLLLLKKNHYCLMTLDIKMPKVDGIVVLREMQLMPHRPKTIMVTGFADMKTALECRRLGAADYIRLRGAEVYKE